MPYRLVAATLCLLAPTWAGAQAYIKASYEINGSRYAWTASTPGPSISNRGQRTLSSPVLPTGTMPQATGVITSVRWRYSFTSTPPIELQAYLCNAERCVLLPGAEGKTEAFLGEMPPKDSCLRSVCRAAADSLPRCKAAATK